MTTNEIVMFAVTVSTVISILITAETKDIVATIGGVGAGIVFVLGLGFSLLLLQNEEKQEENENDEDQGNVF